MNQQEATRAGTVSGLRAGSTVKDITVLSYGDFSKKTVILREQSWWPTWRSSSPGTPTGQ